MSRISSRQADRQTDRQTDRKHHTVICRHLKPTAAVCYVHTTGVNMYMT